MTQNLADLEIQGQLGRLPNWSAQGDRIQSRRTFKDFVEAVAFVNKLVEPAEAAGHHPDIAISYNEVIITLTTHDAGGLTQKDFDLAAKIDQL